MHLVFALPPPAETGGGGGAGYIDGLAEGLRRVGVHADLLTGDTPHFPAGCIPVIDGMLLPHLHERLDALAQADAVALVHHVGAAAGRDDGSRARVLSLSHAMLSRLRRVVATSAPVADRLRAEFGVIAHPIPPGVHDLSPAIPDPDAPIILSVGVLTRRKGHDSVLHTVSRLLDLPWHLVIAGDSQREPGYAAELGTLADQLGLAGRVSIVADPTPDTLDREWCRATVFVSATRWEGYPAAVAEAMQRGIPTLVTSSANAERILPPGAGAICPLEDMATFGKCLRRLLFDTGLRTDMAASALSAGQALPRWTDRAREFKSFLEQHP